MRGGREERETLMCLVASCLHPGPRIQPATKVHAVDWASKPRPFSLRASALIAEQLARVGHTILELILVSASHIAKPDGQILMCSTYK